MDYFQYDSGFMHGESVDLHQLASHTGTPAYVYSKATLKRHCLNLMKVFESVPTLPCFAVKSNSNLTVLKEIFALGFGADVVSVGELERALLAGVQPQQVVFSGVGKREEEIKRALEVGILSFNVESRDELELILSLAKSKKQVAPISLRINPNIDVKTNPHIATGLYKTKFGIPESEAREILASIQSDSPVKVVGLSCHIGSQIVDLKPFQQAVERMAALAQEFKQRFPIEMIDLGGGLGIRYNEETPPSLTAYADTLLPTLKKTGLKLVIEPGRVIVGNMGVLLTQVLAVKQTPAKTFIIVDAAMNDLMRPTLYGAHHEILPVQEVQSKESWQKIDVVGPICETGDFLGRDVSLPPLKKGDYLIVRGCGAYAATMASNYNSRPRACEILIDGSDFTVVRQRESLSDLWSKELAEGNE